MSSLRLIRPISVIKRSPDALESCNFGARWGIQDVSVKNNSKAQFEWNGFNLSTYRCHKCSYKP